MSSRNPTSHVPPEARLQAPHHPAVDQDRRARHVGSGVADQEGGDSAELLHLAQAPERDGLDRGLADRVDGGALALGSGLIELVDARRQHAARGEAVDADAVAGQLDRQGLHECVNGRPEHVGQGQVGGWAP